MIKKEVQIIPETIENSESPIKIFCARTSEEKKEIYHFRYQTYVEEMSKHPQDVDYENKQLSDELDKKGLLLYAKVGSVLIATKRINIGTIKDFPPNVAEFLALKTFQECTPEPSNLQFAFITKLMVAPAYRSSPVLYLLMAKCYEICCQSKIQFIFGICNLHLLPLYEQMGCRRYYKNFLMPGYGLAVPIVLLADDIQHLRKVRSPLFRIARKRNLLNLKAVDWFNSTLPNNYLNSQIITEDELWNFLHEKFNLPPTKVISLLHDLSEKEAKTFLHNCGILVQCELGDTITIQGDVSYAYNVLITGKLKSLTFQNPVKEFFIPGQHFGANGLTEHNKHTEEIVAISFTEILILSGIAFKKFFRSHSDIAHKIVKNIRNLTISK